MESQNQPAGVRPTFLRAFIPFWITAASAVVIFLQEYHQRHAPRTFLKMQVLVDGAPPEDQVNVAVNGKPFDLREPIGVGLKWLRISTPYTRPFADKRWVWYGPNDLGTINLEREATSLQLVVHPDPDEIELHSGFFNTRSTNGLFARVLCGRYQAAFRYGKVTSVEPFEVTPPSGGKVDWNAQVGVIQLASDPPEGDFEISGARHSFSGKFPATSPPVEVGEYRLVAHRADYRIESKVTLRAGETNRVLVKFVYGGMEITTDPPGANAFLGRSSLGRTPLLLTNVVPGAYHLVLSKDGFDPSEFDVQVGESSVARLDSKLVNTRYRQSVAEARAAMAEGRFHDAVTAFEAALAEQPGDPTVSALLPEARLAVVREKADQLVGRSDFRSALQILNQVAQPDAKLAGGTYPPEGLAKIKAHVEQTAQDAARGALQKAVEASKANNYPLAFAHLEQARQWAPDLPDIRSVEREVRERSATWDAQAGDRRRAQANQKRREEMDDALTALTARYPGSELFPVGKWKTAKTINQVRNALAVVALTYKWMKVSDERKINEYLFTAKYGDLSADLKDGRDAWFAICEIEPGLTEIRLKIPVYLDSISGSRPRPYPEVSQTWLGRIREGLNKALDGALSD